MLLSLEWCAHDRVVLAPTPGHVWQTEFGCVIASGARCWTSLPPPVPDRGDVPINLGAGKTMWIQHRPKTPPAFSGEAGSGQDVSQELRADGS